VEEVDLSLSTLKKTNFFSVWKQPIHLKQHQKHTRRQEMLTFIDNVYSKTMFKKALFILTILLPFGLSAQLVVDNTVTAEQAVQDILLGGGVEVSNITFSGDANQIGSFNSDNSNIGLASGVTLATGDIAVGVGPNNAGGSGLGGGNFGVNDPDLDQLSTFDTNDAAVLEFDFVPNGDSLVFRYVFSSEEYNEYVCGSVNDAFGFFLSGPGINGPFSDNAVNLAIIPDTDIPVTINTVNNGTSGANGFEEQCAQVSPDWDQNAAFYIDNENNGDPNSTQFDGLTVVLTAATSVECGETYHIKIAIADAGDTAFDSAVFLEADSFTSPGSISVDVPNAPPNFPTNSILEGCFEGILTIARPNLEVPDEIQIILEGTATNGEDYEEIETTYTFPEGELQLTIPVVSFSDDIDEDTETVIISYDYVNACGDVALVTQTLNIVNYTDPSLDLQDPLSLCNGESQNVNATPVDGFAPFTFTWSTGDSNATNNITSEDAGMVSVDVIDFCQSQVADSFMVVVPEPFVVVDSMQICIAAPSLQLASGGSPEYEYTVSTWIDLNEIEPTDTTIYTNTNGSFTFDQPALYYVGIVDECGESGLVEINVVGCDTRIPNVFTPGDGNDLNNSFVIEGIEGFPNSELLVFNRWGNLVYEDSNYRNNWRGLSQNGDELAEGTYYYIYRRSDGEEFSGEVTILRKP
jgi:gliding motility-associated-like protein